MIFQSYLNHENCQKNTDIVLLNAPWNVTKSFRKKNLNTFDHLYSITNQVDIADPLFTFNSTFADLNDKLEKMNAEFSHKADTIINCYEKGLHYGLAEKELLIAINQACEVMNNNVFNISKTFHALGKKTALFGGDHSTILGHVQSLADHHETFGVLQLDAHMDLLECYQGFMYSHASIMRHVEKLDSISTIIQCGVRDYLPEEVSYANQSNKITTVFNHHLKEQLYQGKTWNDICQTVCQLLPKKIYITCDIDVLNPSACPNTGTPVPGGLDFDQIYYLFLSIIKNNIEIIGFDLVETVGDKNSLDIITANRLLYVLMGISVNSTPQKG